MKCFKKIIPFFFVFAILVPCLIVPGSAAESDSRKYTAVPFWGAVGHNGWHGAGFWGTAEDYDQYVNDLRSDLGTTTLIDGGIRIYFPSVVYYTDSCNTVDTINLGYTTSALVSIYDVLGTATSHQYVYFGYDGVVAPFACKYTSYSKFLAGNSYTSFSLSGWFKDKEVVKGEMIYANTRTYDFDGITKHCFYMSTAYDDVILNGSAQIYADLYPLVMADLDNNTSVDISVNSRPSSITGDYGIIGDNGSIIKVDGNMIVDESSSTVYNPVTNTTLNYTDYAYDYSDRSYNLTLEDGSTMKVTYGDENVTINEGDTVYNIYYIVPEADQEDDGSGSGGSGDTHSHDYTSEITKLPNCLLSGVRTFTCSCGDSYTKTVPATGHDWQISQQIANTFDPETGEPLTTGYTIYTCATCGEQYKSTDGNAPPNGSSGDSDKETIWDKIGTLFGTIGNGIIGLIEAALSKVLDGLISLAETISEKLKTVVELVLGWLDEIPALFGGFLSFLGALFSFLPAECVLLLEFGLAAVIFIGIINLLRRR